MKAKADLLNGRDVHVADLIPLTNAMQQVDLARILFYTPQHRRAHVAVAYLGLSFAEWAAEAGFTRADLYQWIYDRRTLPLGAALRLARVLGLSVDELFGEWTRGWEPSGSTGSVP